MSFSSRAFKEWSLHLKRDKTLNLCIGFLPLCKKGTVSQIEHFLRRLSGSNHNSGRREEVQILQRRVVLSIMQIFVCVFVSFYTRFVVRIGDGVEFFASRVARKNPIRELFLGLLKGGEFDGRAGRLVSSTVL